MKQQSTLGILAHVDAGKTTLSEALLYLCGNLKSLGRVDHQNAFLDHAELERTRGITIFSKEAILSYRNLEITLLDTPGHVDFSTEMERCLQALDYAVLLISASEGVQSHTRTLWRLLSRYEVPVFIFVNKMDLHAANEGRVLAMLETQLDENCIRFGAAEDAAWLEQLALCDEDAMTAFLASGTLTDAEIAALIKKRRLFPCYFGSALKLFGVDVLLEGFSRFTQTPHYPAEFGARVFRVSRDRQGARLTHLKITGGSLAVKDRLLIPDGEMIKEEKVEQIRRYSGEKFQTLPMAEAGMVCALTGLSHTRPGQGLGREATLAAPLLEPVMRYRLLLPAEQDPYLAFSSLRQLEDEEPSLSLHWNAAAKEIYLRGMGEIQLEILKELIAARFGLLVGFDGGNILYKETIAEAVEGIGHFEPLGHYAEVHLLLTPLPAGSGLQFSAECDSELLPGQWQRLILSCLREETPPGVLTGSPLTDLRLTLMSGKAHQKHTEGGDFREAAYRALRQGLKSAKSILLEPWYRFRMEIPAQAVGRAMTELRQMGAEFSPPAMEGNDAILEGDAPVSALGNYSAALRAYTRGEGRLFCSPSGYRPAPDAEGLVSTIAYDSEADTAYPSSSVFCSHGAGFFVPWNRVRAHMHLPALLPQRRPVAAEAAPSFSGKETLEGDKELMAIYERTYGPIRRRDFLPQENVRREEAAPQRSIPEPRPEYLLVDGYNIIHAWDELKALAEESLDAARKRLMDILSNYQGIRRCQVILVFDAYKVPGGTGSMEKYHNIHVVYTKEAETADHFIEKTTYALGKRYRVRVATSDNTEQLIILGHGALRVSAKAFHAEVEQSGQEISSFIAGQKRGSRSREMEAVLKSALEAAEAEGN